MTVRLANEIRPTHMPVYCSACRDQNPNLAHIDFDAGCDRGYGHPAEGFKFGVRMDFLILCENCIKIAAAKLGMIEADAWKNERESLSTRLSAAEKRADDAELYAENLEGALRLRPGTKDNPYLSPELRAKAEAQLCECGCGDPVNPGSRFIRGHHLRKGVREQAEKAVA